MLEPGTQAPTFTLPEDQGDEVALKDLRGRKVVLYFYPKDPRLPPGHHMKGRVLYRHGARSVAT